MKLQFIIIGKVKIFGYNAFLMFYDIKKNKEIQTLKLGDGEDGRRVFLANKDNLILERNRKLVVIDIKSRNIKKEIKIEHYLRLIITLNENRFLVQDYNNIYEYEIESKNKITLKEQKRIENKFIGKYPDNKLIIIKDKTITIYGY